MRVGAAGARDAAGASLTGVVLRSAATKDRSAEATSPRPFVRRSSDPSVAEFTLSAAEGLPQDDARGAIGQGADARDAKLRGAARQLTGVFAQQLFKAMRETVPQGEGAVSGGSGEEMFTGLLDEHLAGADPHGGAAGAAFTRGLAEAVYRRLRAHAGGSTAGSTPGGAAGPAAAPSASAPNAPTLGPQAGAPAAGVTPDPSAASLREPAPFRR